MSTPVFTTPEELVTHLEQLGATTSSESCAHRARPLGRCREIIASVEEISSQLLEPTS